MGNIPRFVLEPQVQHKELKLAESYAPSHGGLLPDDPFWRIVEERYSTAVTSGHLKRFEHYHPVISPLLRDNMEALQAIPPSRPIELPILDIPPITVAVPSPPVTIPGTPVMPPVASVPVTPPSVPQAVPEPSSVILAAFGLAVVILVGWWFKA